MGGSNMKIIDFHCDTILETWRHPEINFYNGDLSINIEKLKKGGALAQCFAMWISDKSLAHMSPFDIVKSMLSRYEELLDAFCDDLAPATCLADIEKNEKEGKVSSILTIEDGAFVENDIERLNFVYEKGVRLITLIWNYENTIGFPNSDNPIVHQNGLKSFGIDVVKRMNELGIIVDVSHLSEGGFFDVAKHSSAPFVASHSCARALCNHRRNLTDDQLRILGAKGGFVGVNFERSFLEEGSEGATFEQIERHLLYMKNKAGMEAIGFGSDFDGIETNGELVDYTGFPRLIEYLQGSFTDDEIDMMCNLNAKRIIKDVLG